jgi:hypothetical protein
LKLRAVTNLPNRLTAVILPSIKCEASGKRVSVAFVVIVGVDDGQISYEHIDWEQATVLVQIGLLDPTGLPGRGRAGDRAVAGPDDPRPALRVGATRPAQARPAAGRSRS